MPQTALLEPARTAKAWIFGLIAVLALVWTGVAVAKTDRLLSRQQALAAAGRVAGHSAAGQYLAGRLAQHKKDYGSAAEFLEGALGRDPNNLSLRRQVFLLMLAEGRLDDALFHSWPLHRHDPADVLPVLTQSIGAMRDGDYEAALGHFGALDNNGFSGLVRILGQAWALVGLDDLPGARVTLAFSKDQQDWSGILTIHTALIEDVGGGDRALTAYKGIVDNKAARSTRTMDLVRNYEARRKNSEANPEVRSVADGLAEGFLSISEALNQGKRTMSALIYAQLGMALRQDSDMLRLLVAEIMTEEDRHADAAAVYAGFSQESERYYSAQIARARSLARADLTEEAIAALRAIAAEIPQHATASSVLGDILRGEKRFVEAVAAYDDAAASMGPEAAAKDWRLLYTRGIALERAGEWERAEQDLQTALALNGEHAHVLNYLGYSWIDRGENLEKAEEMVRRATELRPKDGFIADSLGWAYYRTGRYAEAVEELERAITLEPLDPVINDHLGDAFWQVGRKAEARFQWRRSLNLELEPDLVETIKEKLRCGLEGCNMARRTE